MYMYMHVYVHTHTTIKNTQQFKKRKSEIEEKIMIIQNFISIQMLEIYTN